MKNNFEPDKVLNILHDIANYHEVFSKEYLAIELASKAILFIHANGLHISFKEYINSFGNELTSEQINFLESIGLKSD